MIRRSTKIYLIVFVVITLLGISYVSVNYVGLGQAIVGNSCKVKANFDNSGGIFTNAEVTYRGVAVGKVGQLHLLGPSKELPKGGVQVDLELDSCTSPRIPASASANIANRSVVGEQYVNLIPPNGARNDSPKLAANSTIPASRNSTPVPTDALLRNIDSLVTSVPLKDLQTTVSELYNLFHDRGEDLGNLLDASNELLDAASEPGNLSATLKLIEDSSTVLQTQIDLQSPLQSWTRSLNLLSQQLKASDPDIRHLIDSGPGDLDTVSNFIQDNRTDFGVVLANLATTGDIVVRYLPNVKEILALYPALAAGSLSVVRPDPTVAGKYQPALGLVLQLTPDPQDCGDPKKNSEGYNTVRREPGAVGPITSNVGARCTGDPNVTNPRGAAHVPGGDPISLSGGDYAYSRVGTQGTSGGSATASPKVGDRVAIGPAAAPKIINKGRYVSLLTASLG